jgi:beta-galactosidase/beta-glucuronidase
MQPLHGQWEIAIDPSNCGRTEYWLRFHPAASAAAGQHSLLRFDAIDYVAKNWLNGAPVGGHEGDETPFAIDVTEALIVGEKLLAVRVLNPADEPIDGIHRLHRCHRLKISKSA